MLHFNNNILLRALPIDGIIVLHALLPLLSPFPSHTLRKGMPTAHTMFLTAHVTLVAAKPVSDWLKPNGLPIYGVPPG